LLLLLLVFFAGGRNDASSSTSTLSPRVTIIIIIGISPNLEDDFDDVVPTLVDSLRLRTQPNIIIFVEEEVIIIVSLNFACK
tara:strand:- start:666 stop:911 length:246 start_codon:yes stop_codon:yes gene_type:complete